MASVQMENKRYGALEQLILKGDTDIVLLIRELPLHPLAARSRFPLRAF